MIKIKKFTLSNGLRVVFNPDSTTGIVAMNIVYDVGARDENPLQTGFAHLFEHLMFEGSKHIPNYDKPLQQVGGENNAFTNNDITNYYLTIPKQNLETGFWLESDRMLDLAFSQEKLDIQKSVVSEEFKQRYLNQPYGDVWLNLRPLAYQVHPYMWPTIGKELSHINDAKMKDVQSFFNRFYKPNNAVLSISGDLSLVELEKLCEKWFQPIEMGQHKKVDLPQEPVQKKQRRLTLERPVPLDALYITFHMVGRNHPDYHVYDLISDVLSRGNASRLYLKLKKELKIFSQIDAYITGDRDPGLFVISGKLNPSQNIQNAEEAVWQALKDFCKEGVSQGELEKVKNKAQLGHHFSQIGVLNKAMNMAYNELIGDVELCNTEIQQYLAIDSSAVARVSGTLFKEENSSVLHYLSKQ